jgi:hypothetical protein
VWIGSVLSFSEQTKMTIEKRKDVRGNDGELIIVEQSLGFFRSC